MRTNIRRRQLLTAGAAFLATMAGRAADPEHASPVSAPDPADGIDIWPAQPPGMPTPSPAETLWDRSTNPSVADRAVRGIARPRFLAFRPDRPNGAAVLLFPGGGYHHVVVDKEGYEMARWLAACGFGAFVLFYRLPGDGWAAGPDVALCDAQRAVRVLRRRASEFGFAPDRLATMGFSAGGHLCADLSARFAARVYDAIDDADAISARPCCAATIYPVVSMRAGIAHVGSRRLLVGTDATEALEAAHSPDRNITGQAPPHFIVHAEDDASVPVENALLLRAALKAQGVSVETHLFRSGGHGFGLRGTTGKPVAAWPELWHAWARSTGLA
jgi:acetyl esterase/lipase